MRSILIFIVMAFGGLANAQSASPSIEGRWLSGEWGGVRSIVEVKACDAGYCGTIVGVRGGEAPDGAIGHMIFWGFAENTVGAKGKLKPPGRAPRLGATIKELTATSMTLRACGFGIICQNETMERL